MMKKEIEDRVKLLEKIGGIIREESKAYGIIDAAWGAAILVGFSVFQIVELLAIPWYYGFAALVISIISALVATPLLKQRIEKHPGYTGKGWLRDRIGKSWLVIAMIGGASYMFVFWSPLVSNIILEHLSPRDISGFILIGWLIIDGIGSMVQGIISESKAYMGIGILMVISAIVVANVGFIYAWSAFALTFGLGYLVVGLRDYYSFKKTLQKAGVNIE